jgi:hypothetical protein
MNAVYKPVIRQLSYITLYGIVQAIVQHQDNDEIMSIVDGIRNENDWTIDGDAQHTLHLTADVLRGVEKWISRHPHPTFMHRQYSNAVRTYRIADEYLCDIGIASDL